MKNLFLAAICIVLTPIAIAQNVGDRKTVTAISHLKVKASWDGCSARTKSGSAVFNPAPGWVIESFQVKTHSESNGSQSVSLAAGGLNFVQKSE